MSVDDKDRHVSTNQLYGISSVTRTSNTAVQSSNLPTCQGMKENVHSQHVIIEIWYPEGVPVEEFKHE